MFGFCIKYLCISPTPLVHHCPVIYAVKVDTLNICLDSEVLCLFIYVRPVLVGVNLKMVKANSC